jgi:hypothetical protein
MYWFVPEFFLLKADGLYMYTKAETFLFNPKQDQSKTFQFGPEIISAYAERFYLIPKKR